MLNPMIIDILVNRIINSGINPVTGEPMKLDDIKDEAYKDAVQVRLGEAPTE